MTDYNDGNWHGWNGGECPVHPKTQVDAIWIAPHIPMGITRETRVASGLVWKGGIPSSIVTFRVIKQHREPLQAWLRRDKNGAFHECSDEHPDATLFREVLE